MVPWHGIASHFLRQLTALNAQPTNGDKSFACLSGYAVCRFEAPAFLYGMLGHSS